LYDENPKLNMVESYDGPFQLVMTHVSRRTCHLFSKQLEAKPVNFRSRRKVCHKEMKFAVHEFLIGKNFLHKNPKWH